MVSSSEVGGSFVDLSRPLPSLLLLLHHLSLDPRDVAMARFRTSSRGSALVRVAMISSGCCNTFSGDIAVG